MKGWIGRIRIKVSRIRIRIKVMQIRNTGRGFISDPSPFRQAGCGSKPKKEARTSRISSWTQKVCLVGMQLDCKKLFYESEINS
jgi:hypothetical protein